MKEALKEKLESTTEVNKHNEWFSLFINQINEGIMKDKEALEKGDASKETIAFYQSLIKRDSKALIMARDSITDSLISDIVISYIHKIKERNIRPLKLAFDLSINKIMVWAEINADDEKTEMDLIRVESIINGEFFANSKIYLDSTIVENSDELPIPLHYKRVSL